MPHYTRRGVSPGPGRCNAALHPAGVLLRPPVGPDAVMRHYTRWGVSPGLRLARAL